MYLWRKSICNIVLYYLCIKGDLIADFVRCKRLSCLQSCLSGTVSSECQFWRRSPLRVFVDRWICQVEWTGRQVDKVPAIYGGVAWRQSTCHGARTLHMANTTRRRSPCLNSASYLLHRQHHTRSKRSVITSIYKRNFRGVLNVYKRCCFYGIAGLNKLRELRKQFKIKTRMWANAQRDGRPAEYRWRPLFNAAKFGWRALLECHAVTLPRRETRCKLQGCSKLANRSQPLVGRSSPYYDDMWRRYRCLPIFSDCRYMA